MEARQLRIDPGVSSTDDRLLNQVRQSLKATGRRHLEQIHVTVSEGRVRLAGKVPSYFAKQLVHQAALSVTGIQAIDCGLDVQ